MRPIYRSARGCLPRSRSKGSYSVIFTIRRRSLQSYLCKEIEIVDPAADYLLLGSQYGSDMVIAYVGFSPLRDIGNTGTI